MPRLLAILSASSIVLLACGGSAPASSSRTTTRRPASGPTSATTGSAPTATPSTPVPPDDRVLALEALASAFPAQTPRDHLTEWRLAPDLRLFLATVEESNAGPAVFWVRLDAPPGVPASGSLGLAFPESLALEDLDGDGRTELLVFGGAFTGESPPEHEAIEAYELPPGATAPVRMPRLSALALASGAGDPARLEELRRQLDQFFAPGAPIEAAQLVIGLDRATPAQLREVASPGGVELCVSNPGRRRTVCRRMPRVGLTDVRIAMVVVPALGRFPISTRETRPPYVTFWTSNVTCNTCDSDAEATCCEAGNAEGARILYRLRRTADRWSLERIERIDAAR